MTPVAIDAMGGDSAPSAIVEGAVRASRRGIPVLLVGDRAQIEPVLPRRRLGRDAPIDVLHTDVAVAMDAAPSSIRRQSAVSIRMALRAVHEGRACAGVSCGSTGATLVAAMLELGTVDGVERPAIATLLPRRDGGRLILLDAGANVDCRPELLAEFARLGVDYARTIGIAEPRVGLLSIGSESGKGNVQVRATLPLLESLDLRLVGNVEPTSAMEGACDVLVCDGFVGNILLKAAEGAVSTVVHLLREEIRRRPSGRLGAFLLRGAFERFRDRVAWEATGGALLLGANGVVVVGHGRARAAAVANAIEMAWTCRR